VETAPRRFGRHSTDFSTFLNPPSRKCSPRHAPDLESGKTEDQAQDEPEAVRGGPAVGEKWDAPQRWEGLVLLIPGEAVDALKWEADADRLVEAMFRTVE